MGITQIDPEGDVILEVGKSKTGLLVASKVLSLASPVFEAMFKPHFKEGIQKRVRLKKPLTIPLPEDDAEAFLLFCNVIHYRSHQIHEEPSPLCLGNLALICDKYQCASPMVAYGALWLKRYLRDVSQDDLCRLLFLAYVLDLPDRFEAISREILFVQEGPFTSLPVLTNCPFLRHDLLGEFKARRITMIQRLQEAIMRPVSQLTNFHCDTVATAIGTYHCNLKRSGLSPYENSFDEQSVLKIMKEADNVWGYEFKGCRKGSCKCWHFAPTCLGTELGNEMRRFEDEKLGLCLDCVKTAGKSNEEGKCRERHLY